MTNYSILLDEKTLDKFRTIAKENYVTPAQIIRRVLDQWLSLYGDTPWVDLRPPHFVNPSTQDNKSTTQTPSQNLYDQIKQS